MTNDMYGLPLSSALEENVGNYAPRNFVADIQQTVSHVQEVVDLGFNFLTTAMEIEALCFAGHQPIRELRTSGRDGARSDVSNIQKLRRI